MIPDHIVNIHFVFSHFFIQKRPVDSQHFSGPGLVVVGFLQGKEDGFFFCPGLHIS